MKPKNARWPASQRAIQLPSARLRSRFRSDPQTQDPASTGSSMPSTQLHRGNSNLHQLPGLVNEKHPHIVVRQQLGTSYGVLGTYSDCNESNHRQVGKTLPIRQRPISRPKMRQIAHSDSTLPAKTATFSMFDALRASPHSRRRRGRSFCGQKIGRSATRKRETGYQYDSKNAQTRRTERVLP